jgi:hypothetical protein
MLGPLGDAFLLFLGTVLTALLTFKLWYPALSRLFSDVKRDLDDSDESVLGSKRHRS